MINQKSVDVVNSSKFTDCFRKPLYSSYCFANIPGTIETLLSGSSELETLPADTRPDKEYDKAILFFVDAFGWRFFDQYKDKYPTIRRMVDEGMVSKITSQFPSTTSAHVTTIKTGKPVGETGVFEWFYYEPKIDAMIAPLLYSYAGDDGRDTLAKDIPAEDIYPTGPFFNSLVAKGVSTHIFQSADFTPSPYGVTVSKGVQHLHPFTDLESGLRELQETVMSEQGKGYYYFYYGDIDSAGHRYGVNSPEFIAKIDTFFTSLEELFVQVVSGNCGNTVMLMTADHGQTEIDPATTIYLNQAVPEIIEWTRVNDKGELLVIGGSCRDVFLYIKDEYVDTAKARLQEVLQDKAEVYHIDELLEAGFFGENPSDLLKSRLGNLCILPYEGESVFWWEEGKFEQKFYGNHGGLLPDEMDSVFALLEL